MDKMRLVHDFVDGQLPIEHEEELFLHIAQDSELRQEMKDLVAMKNASSSIKSVFTPAPESTLNVFSTLGFTAPVGTVSKLPWYSRYGQGIKAGAASALVVALLMFWYFTPTEIGISNNVANNSIPVTSSEDISSNDVLTSEFISTVDNSIFSANNTSVNNSTSRNNTIIAQRSRSNQNAVVLNESANIAVNTTENEFVIDNNVNNNNDKSNLWVGTPLSNSDIAFNTVYQTELGQEFRFHRGFNFNSSTNNANSDSKFALEMSGSQQNHFSEPSMEPAKLSNFNNYNITMLYDVNENFSVGLGFRQETFSNTFVGVDELGVKYQYEAQPNYSSLGLVLRYYAGNYSGIMPFGEFMIGANSVGLTNAASLGLKYNVFDRIALVGSFELSNLTYNYQGSLFNSSKYGFRYGLQYNM